MARYTDASCRLCRREGQKLFLKGSRCYSDKCSVTRRNYAPGQHGQKRTKLSEYGTQLREKQKTRSFYGVGEKQFRKYFEMASNKKGITGTNLLQILESRLDNVVYRLGFGSSRAQARQFVNHAQFEVNGKKVDIASYLTKVGDVIALKETSKNLKVVAESLESIRSTAAWVSFNKETKEGKVERFPERNELNPEINESLVVEYYNRLD